MDLSEPIVLWMEPARLYALAKAIAAPDEFWCGGDVKQLMQDKLDQLYESKVSIEDRQSIEAPRQMPAPSDTTAIDMEKTYCNTLFRVAERGGVHMAAIFNSFDLLDAARIIDCYRRGGFALLKPSGFLDLLGDMRIAYPSEFAAAIDGNNWHGNELAGIYSIDFDKALLAVSSSLLEWTAYSLDDVCAAARRACGVSTGDATDEMRTVFREEMGRIKKQPYNPLESYTLRRN